MDVSAANAVESILVDAKDNDKVVLMSGVNAENQRVMEGMHLDKLLSHSYFGSRLEALNYAKAEVLKV